MNMSSIDEQKRRDELNQRHAAREEAIRQIDPKTAVICYTYRPVCDPYYDYPEEPELGLDKFVFCRSPTSDIWVLVTDLPDDVYRKLCEFHDAKKASSEQSGTS